MTTVYCITGCRVVDWTQTQAAYFLTKKEAFAAAREWTIPDSKEEGDSCEVTQIEIAWPITRKMLINLLHHESFAIRQEPVWRFKRGRMVKE